MKQRGSALIISMMLIATVGATAFGIARLLFVDTAISTTYENGALAYYAAESGMEEGFLRYKYNMNAEVPYADWVLQGIPRAKNVFRSNLFSDTVITSGGVYTAGQGIEGIGGTTDFPLVSSSQLIYDLRMGYLGVYNPTSSSIEVYNPKFYHQMNNGDKGIYVKDVLDPAFSIGDYSFLRVPKDESRKFDLSNVNLSSGNRLNIGLRFAGVNNGAATFTVDNECKAMAEIKFLITSPAGISKEYKALTSFNPTTCAGYVGIEAGKLDSAEPEFGTGGWTKTIEVSPYGAHDPNVADIGYYYKLNDVLNTVLTKAGATLPSYFGENNINNDKVTMSIKPLYFPADAFFATSGCDRDAGSTCATNRAQVVTGPYSYITSTGYFGGVTRTLKANIDRQSGTLYDLYDYVLFKGN